MPQLPFALWLVALSLLCAWAGWLLAVRYRSQGSSAAFAEGSQTHSTLHIAINSQPDAWLAVDAAGQILLANEAARKLFVLGENQAGLLTPSWPAEQGLFVPDTTMVFPFEEMPLFRAMQGDSGGPIRIFLRNARHPEGRMLSYRFMPMQGSRRIEGALCIFTDITELDWLLTSRQLAELEVARTTEILNRTGKMAKIGGWETDVQTWESVSTEAIYRIHEVEPSFVFRPRDAIGFYAPVARPVIRAAARAALEQGTPWDLELPLITARGHPIWVRTQGSVLHKEGKVHRLVGVLQDITERKQAEQALQESQQRYAALFDAAPVAMWVHDGDFQFLKVNQAAVNAYGYSAAEFLEMRIFDIWPDARQAYQTMQQHPKTAAEAPYSWQHQRRDGSFFPVNVQMRPIENSGIAACFVVALDMTAQVQAEKEVQSHLFTLQRAADATRAITWHQSLEGTIQEFAEQARLVVGAHHAIVSLSTGEQGVQATQALSISDKYTDYRETTGPLDGTSTFALVCQHHRSLRMEKSQIRANTTGQSFGDYADQHPAMQGWLAVALTGRDGKNIGLLQLSDKYQGDFTQQDEYVAVELAQLASVALEKTRLIHEVSQLNAGLEKKVAERTAALAEQEAKFRALAEEAPEIVWTADPRGAITYVNKAWFDLVGGVWGDWSSGRWHTVIHPDDLPEMKANWSRAVEEGIQYNGIRRIRSKDGSWHMMSYRSVPVLDAEGKVSFWVGIDTDISAIKAVEAALRLSNQELEAFSYSVSHDLRSPLNTIDGFSRVLGKQLKTSPASDERTLHCIDRIQAGVAKMGKLIEDLLSLAQVSRVQLSHRAVDLSSIAHSILDQCQQRQPERQVQIHIMPGLLAYGDSRLVGVVLENLLGNAWKFTAHTVAAKIRVGVQDGAVETLVFFVSDNGAGFDMAYADKLFVPFQRLHASSEFSGTGIGLATVSRVVQRHGGKVWAEAAPGQGATFFFTLPKSPVVL